MADLLVNPVKHRLKNKEKVMAAWIQTGSPVAAEILADIGFDVLIVDMEHSPTDPRTLVSLLQAMKGTPVVPFARAPWNDLVAIKRILDCGVMGISIPTVTTYDEALAAVRACKYPPRGNRGIAASPRAAGYGANANEYLQRANDEIVVMIAVEAPEAADHLDRILAIEDLDGVFIGPTDLSTSMGYFNNPAAPEVQRKIAEIEAKVMASDKFLATVARSLDQAKAFYDKGYSFLVVTSDENCLRREASAVVRGLREHFQAGQAAGLQAGQTAGKAL